MNTLDLARIQFASTTILHFLFVALTLGLAPFVAFMQTRYAITGNAVHERSTRFWGQIYVINYGVGIITGLLLEFQFGLNWSGLIRYAGDVFGAPLAMETLAAFFLEATFLGIWIFGWGRLPKSVHLLSFYLVMITAYASAYFIMVANGYMQHPVGDTIAAGRAHIDDLSALLTNPGALDGFAHIVPAVLMVGAFTVAGVSAWHLRRRTGDRDVHAGALRLGVLVGLAAAWFTMIMGYRQLPYLKSAQPAKVGTLYHYGPSAHRFDLHHLQAVYSAKYGPGHYVPPGWISHPYHWMVNVAQVYQYVGIVLALLLIGSLIERLGFVLRVLTWAIPIPFVVVILGWLVREVGRQPWIVWGRLQTGDAVTDVSAGAMLASLVVFLVLYLACAVVDWVLIAKHARRGTAATAMGTTVAELSVDTAAPL